MDQQGKSLRFGTAMLLCALTMRLGATGLPGRVTDFFSRADVQSFLLYLETGRNVRFSPSLDEGSEPVATPLPPTVPTTVVEEALPCFTALDAALLDIRYNCRLSPDLEALTARSLSWDLTIDAPTVLILHTHATESYTPSGEDYNETSPFRTLDERYNMLSIGDRVAQLLTQGGITVLQDRQLHDYPSYNGSYADARETIRAYLEEYPSIRLVLDLHRDASGDLSNQFRPVVSLNGLNTAQIMLVMGTNASGGTHPNWEENLSLGLKLQLQLERQAPGITRPLSLRAQRFNQDLTPGSLLIEVGAAGNTHAEALRAAEQLAAAILALARGTA